MNDEILREAIEYKKRRLAMIIFFFVLIAIPFGFAIYSYIELKECQASESNGCPTLSLPAVPNTAHSAMLQSGSQTLYTDYTTNNDVQKII